MYGRETQGIHKVGRKGKRAEDNDIVRDCHDKGYRERMEGKEGPLYLFLFFPIR